MKLTTTLTALGHDVRSAAEDAPTASDVELIGQALAAERILLTEDKAFGDLVFVQRLPHPCIVHLADMAVSEKTAATRGLIHHHSEAMRTDTIIVGTRNRVRMRRQAQ